MYCPVTLTAKEFNDIHNALWKLGQDPNREVVEKQVEIVRAALKGAYDQERADFERKNAHYKEVARKHKFASVWSLYEVANLQDAAPFNGVDMLRYAGVEVPVPHNPTWLDLWFAADAAMSASGDEHHIFIEQFVPVKDSPRVLELWTGS